MSVRRVEGEQETINLHTEGSAGRKAGRKEWLGLAIIAIPCMLYSMDLTVLNLAAPRLSADLRPSSTQFLWIMDIYGFLIAGSLITMGTLGDRIGRRKLLLIGAALFGLVSVLAAFSKTPAILIAPSGLLRSLSQPPTSSWARRRRSGQGALPP